MPITVKLGDAAKPPQATVELQISKTMGGNLLITDHEKMDILIVPEQKKISTMPKLYIGDDVYEYQRDLMDSLFHGGVIDPDGVQGGVRFGVLEAFMAEPVEDVDPVQIALLEIEKYIKKTLGEEIKADEYDKNIEDRFTDPNEKESTEYGEIKPEEEEPYRQSQVQDPEYTFVGQGYLY
jgi:hypothetical protein|tara:strand:+ start:50 stop:589 length:540 start_codon:yes stop_codon:yes gene_type:complete